MDYHSFAISSPFVLIRALTAKPANQQGRFGQWFLIVKVEEKKIY